MAGRLIVEHLDGEMLVYDTERNEAHALNGVGAAEFAAAPDEVSRREVLRKLALAGAAAAGAGALVKTIVAPTAAQAQTGIACGAATCAAGQVCCSAPTGLCCAAGQCCSNIFCDPICPSPASACSATVGTCT
jgi:hypothetical protein